MSDTKNAVRESNISLTRRVNIVLADRDGNPNAILAADSKQLPTRIELLRCGIWRESWKGTLIITPDDLVEMKEHFDAGVGLPGGGVHGAPIDFMHEDWAKAACWFKEVEIEDESLFATKLEWTKSGTEAVLGGDFKFFSPSFYPKGRGGYENPENPEEMTENVIVGGGLTNIPFFKGLNPITASAVMGDKDSKPQLFFITASNVNNERSSMDLAELRAKNVDELDDSQKAFITENKAELTAEELAKFGLEAEATTTTNQETNQVTETEEQKEAAALQASVKSGQKVVMDASQVKAMQDQLTDLRTKDVKAEVTKHLSRGAIKADQVDEWTKRIMADASIKPLLESIPDNQIMADAIGSEDAAGDATADEAKLQERATQIKADAWSKENKVMKFSEAYEQAIKEKEQK